MLRQHPLDFIQVTYNVLDREVEAAFFRSLAIAASPSSLTVPSRKACC